MGLNLREIPGYLASGSAALALFILALRLLSSLGLTYYPTVARITYVRSATPSLTGSSAGDYGVFITLAALLLLSVLLGSLSVKGRHLGFRYTFFETLARRLPLSLVAVLIAVNLGALARWLLYPAFPTGLFSDWTWSLASLESSLFQLLGLASPYLVLVVVFWWIVVPFVRSGDSLFSLRARLGVHQRRKRGAAEAEGGEAPTTSSFLSAHSRLVFGCALFLSVFLSVYPHLPGVNPYSLNVSTDVDNYAGMMSTLLKDQSLSGLVYNAFKGISGGDRPLFLLLLFGLKVLTGLPTAQLLEFLPVLLSPLLVSSAYYFLRQASGYRELPAIGALFTAFSFPALAGVYAGLLADWLSLVWIYLFFAFSMRLLRSPSRLNFATSLALAVLVLLTHDYTWPIIAIGVLLFVLYSLLVQGRAARRPNLELLLILLLVSGLDLGKSQLLGLLGGFGADVSVVTSGYVVGAPGLLQFFNRWNNLKVTFEYLVGGIFANGVAFLLAIGSSFRPGIDRGTSGLLFAMTAVGAFPLILGNPLIQMRTLFELPFQILASYGLLMLLRRGAKGPHGGGAGVSLLSSALAVLIVLTQLNYAFGSMASIVP